MLLHILPEQLILMFRESHKSTAEIENYLNGSDGSKFKKELNELESAIKQLTTKVFNKTASIIDHSYLDHCMDVKNSIINKMSAFLPYSQYKASAFVD